MGQFYEDGWSPLSVINTAVGTTKTITVPANKEYRLQHLLLEMITTATIGNRVISISIDSGVAANLIAKNALVPVIAASLTRRASYGLGYPKESAFDAFGYATAPLPDIVLSAGCTINFIEATAADVLDTLKYYLRVLERDVV